MLIDARRTVEADTASVYAFLSDLRNHWQLAGRWVRVLDLSGPEGHPTGGRVELRGPLGTRRRASTKLAEDDGRRRMRIDGIAELASGTSARVTWTVAAEGAGAASVALVARIVRASSVDRLLLLLGGRRWLERRFEATLEQLALALARERGDERPQLVEQPLRARVLEDPFAL